DLCSVDFGDDIPGANAGLDCRTSRHDILDHNAAFRLEPERAAQRCVLSRIGAVLDSYTAARYLPALNKLVVHLDGRVGWKRKSKPGGLPRFGNDGCVDSNNFSGHIDQGTAAVAWVNGCVGLQEALEVVPGAADLGTAFSADDAVRDGVIEAERASNSQHPVSDLDGIGVAQLEDGQVPAGFDFNNRQIGIGVASDELRLKLRFIFETDHDLRGLIHDVVVRQDKAGLIDNKTGAEIPHSLAAVGRIRTAEEVEEIEGIKFPWVPVAIVRSVGSVGSVGIVVAIATANGGVLRRGFGIDVDDGRCDIRRDLTECVGK